MNTTETLLERERKARKLTQKALGAVLGVTEQAAGRYCLGKRAPRRGRDGEEGPAERLARWSGGRITVANFDMPAKPAPARKARKRGVRQ